MSIQFTFFLGIYAVAVIIIAIIAGLNIFHIVKYGKGSKGSRLLLILFLLGFLAIITTTMILLSNIEMNQSVNIFQNSGSNNLLNF